MESQKFVLQERCYVSKKRSQKCLKIKSLPKETVRRAANQSNKTMKQYLMNKTIRETRLIVRDFRSGTFSKLPHFRDISR